MDTFAEEMKFKNWKDWYSILDVQIIEQVVLFVLTAEQQGGEPLLEIYGGSMIRALISVYPEYNWGLHYFQQARKSKICDENRLNIIGLSLNLQSISGKTK